MGSGKLRRRYRHYVRRVRRFVLKRILHTDDPPHRLALGIAIGMFVTFTPTFGFQMLLVAFGAWVLRANKIVGLPIVWISNPATMVPIYWACFEVGRAVLGSEPMGDQWWYNFSHPPVGWWLRVKFYWSELIDIATPLWIGSVVVGLALAVPTYYVVLYLVRSYRLKRWGSLVPPSTNHQPQSAKMQPE